MSRVKGALRKAAGPVRRWMAEPSAAPTATAVDLLVASPLFDENWYSTCADRPMTRREAVEDYLAGPEGRDLAAPLVRSRCTPPESSA